MKILAFLVAFLASNLAFALSQECLSATDVAQIQKDFIFKRVLNIKGLTEDLPLEVCDSQSQSYKLYAALIFIKNLPPLTIQHDDFDLGLMEDAPYEFIKNRSKHIFLETEESSKGGACGMSLTVAFARSGTPNVMHLCPYFAGLSKTTVSGTLIHESRHFEGNKYGHAFCTEGPMVGKLACDRSYEHGGSYGVETEYYVRLFRTPSLPKEVRDQAHSYVLQNLTSRFSQMPLGIRQGALLVDDHAALTYYDGQQAYPIFTPQKADPVALRTNLPVYFDLEAGEVRTYTGNPELVRTEGPFAETFRGIPLEKRAQVLDVHYGNFSCLLYTKTLHCKNREKNSELSLPEGVVAAQFVVLGNLPSEEVVMILAQDGSLYQVPYGSDVSKWKAEDIKLSSALKNYRGVAMLKGMTRIALNMDGEFMKRNDKTSKYEADPTMTGQRYRKIISPYYWSPRLHEL